MNPQLRDRILRTLETLSDERGYQVLDYVEFLERKYAQAPPAPVSIFTKFAESVEDTLRAGKISTSTIAETMGFMNKAMGVLNTAAATGKTVVGDLANTAQRVGSAVNAAATAARPAAGAAGAPPASGPTAAGGTTAAPGAAGAPGTPAAPPPSTPADGAGGTTSGGTG